MPKEYIEKIANSIIFHRTYLRRLNRIGIVLLFISIGLLAYTTLQILSVKEPLYFATTSDGRLIEITAYKE